MTAPVTDLSVTHIAELLLGCLAQEMATVPRPPRSVCLRPGDQVVFYVSSQGDECCDGLAWVRVAGMAPSMNFPVPDQTYTRCPPGQWAVVLEMGAARCAPRPPANVIPTCAEWTDVTHAVLDDAAAMRRALCCFTELEPDRMYVPGLWTPLPVEGGCTGGLLTVTIAVDDCDCTDN